jgi:hypothetical protein
MYLFVRRARLAGGQTRASMMWATEITDRVNQVTGLGVTLHAQVFSAEVGELVWAAAVPDLATLEKGFEKLQVDDFYIAEQDRAHAFMTGPPSDILQQIVHGQMAEQGIGSYTTAGSSVCADGQMSRGVGVAIEVAERVRELTGASTTVSVAQTGPYGGVTWSTAYPGIESLEAAQQAMAADTDLARFIDETIPGVFAADPMGSMQAIYRRVH